MGAFEYSALDRQGDTCRGVIEGDTQRHVRQQLREQGLIPLALQEVSSSPARDSGPRIGAGELALFTRQLASLTGSGLTVEESLQTIARHTARGNVRRITLGLRARVREGYSLAESMSGFPRTFPTSYHASVAAGEQAGRLTPILERLAEHTEQQQQLRQKIAMALLYPAILSVVAILVAGGLIGYVLPQVIEVFAENDQPLPVLTRAMLSLSHFVADYGIITVAFAALGALVIQLVLGRRGARLQWHRILLRFPVVSSLVRDINAARFSSTLGILCSSNVPMPEALEISARTISNLAMRGSVEPTSRWVSEGGSVHAALERSGHFSPVTVQLVSSGEASGRLESMLSHAAEYQNREIESRLMTLVGLFEPFIILVMGAVVLTIVLAILLPIYELNQLIP